MTKIDGPRRDEHSADDWASDVTRALNEQRAHARSFLRQQRERFAERQACFAVQASALAPDGSTEGDPSHGDLSAVIDKLVSEVELLRVELGHQEQPSRNRSPESVPVSESDEPDPHYDDLRRRFEMAVEDLRDVKARNAELEEQLERRGPAAAAPKAAGTAGSVPGGGLDWEAQKRQLMAQLEEFDDEDGDEREDKLTIDGAIRITDQVVAEKEQQISELRAQLENADVRQENQTADRELLDKDEFIQSEREKLQQLQADWTNKLRKAEIEISVERAKLARERAQMQEKIDSYEAQLAEHARREQAGEGPEPTTKKGGGRKWLSRLGLADDD